MPDRWSEYMLFPIVFRCWLLIQFLLSFYTLFWCCLGSWDKTKLRLSETVFMLVFYVSLLKTIFFSFFFSSSWFLFPCSRLSSSWNFCSSLLFCTVTVFVSTTAKQSYFMTVATMLTNCLYIVLLLFLWFIGLLFYWLNRESERKCSNGALWPLKFSLVPTDLGPCYKSASYCLLNCSFIIIWLFKNVKNPL